MKTSHWIFCAALAFGCSVSVAAVSEQEAAKLGKELTPVGAERAATADGAIPEWKGGDMKPPANWKPGQPRPDPYAGEKPQFSIDKSNVDKYRDKLSEGQAEMIKTIPAYRMDVYPTHRSCGYPDFYYQRTAKNATASKLASDGYNLAEALGAAVPFPIPQTGVEAMWNHELQWKGEGFHMNFAGYIPPKGSDQIGEPLGQEEWDTSPMWSPKNKGVADARAIEFLYLSIFTGPPSIAGDATLAHYNLNRPNDLWLYFSSQRRVRRAPTYQYDAPQINTENLLIVDQYYMFNGAMDRYEFKLSGKKELYVPYNLYRLNSTQAKPEDVVKPKFFNRDLMRYEAHRVWVVEATLKKGMRHLFPKRTFYIDNNLDRTAIIDCRGPDPGAFHDSYRAFTVRARLDREHGSHANQLIWEGPAAIIGDTKCSLQSLQAMDGWLAAVEKDTSTKPLPQKLVDDKPGNLLDACFDGNGQKLADGLCPGPTNPTNPDDPSNVVVPVYGTPRMVAGDAITTDANKCQLKPFNAADLGPVAPLFMADQLAALQTLFANGVCDYSKPGVSQQGTIPWLTYQDATGAVIYGGTPLPPAPANSGSGWAGPAFQ